MRKRLRTKRDAKRRPAANSHLRRDALGKRPPFHGRLVLHVLDLLLQCVLVHGGEYTGIHGYSRTPLVAIGNGMARAPIRGKINRAKSGVSLSGAPCNASAALFHRGAERGSVGYDYGYGER